MLNSIKSIGYYTGVGSAVGAAAGAGAGIVTSPLLCGGLVGISLVSNVVFKSSLPPNYEVSNFFDVCKIYVPLSFAALMSLPGGVIGLTYGVAKEIFCKPSNRADFI